MSLPAANSTTEITMLNLIAPSKEYMLPQADLATLQASILLGIVQYEQANEAAKTAEAPPYIQCSNPALQKCFGVRNTLLYNIDTVCNELERLKTWARDMQLDKLSSLRRENRNGVCITIGFGMMVLRMYFLLNSLVCIVLAILAAFYAAEHYLSDAAFKACELQRELQVLRGKVASFESLESIKRRHSFDSKHWSALLQDWQFITSQTSRLVVG